MKNIKNNNPKEKKCCAVCEWREDGTYGHGFKCQKPTCKCHTPSIEKEEEKKCEKCGSEMANLDKYKQYCPNCHYGIDCSCHLSSPDPEFEMRDQILSKEMGTNDEVDRYVGIGGKNACSPSVRLEIKPSPDLVDKEGEPNKLMKKVLDNWNKQAKKLSKIDEILIDKEEWYMKVKKALFEESRKYSKAQIRNLDLLFSKVATQAKEEERERIIRIIKIKKEYFEKKNNETTEAEEYCKGVIGNCENIINLIKDNE